MFGWLSTIEWPSLLIVLVVMVVVGLALLLVLFVRWRSVRFDQSRSSEMRSDVEVIRPSGISVPPLRRGRLSVRDKVLLEKSISLPHALIVPAPSVTLFFGTNRRLHQSDHENQIATFTSKRTQQLKLGRAVIRIPSSHKRGNIERPWAVRFLGATLYELAEDPSRHFTRAEVTVLQTEEFVEAVSQWRESSDSAFVFIHGCSVGFDAALYRTAQLAYDLDFNGIPLLFSWPARESITSYKYDLDSCLGARAALRQFLDLIVVSARVRSVHLIAHSMGNVPLVEVLREYLLSQSAAGPRVTFSEVVFAAPDIACDTFAALAKQIAPVAKGATLYASANDKALLASKALAGGIARAGDVPLAGPLLVEGVDSIDVSAASTDYFGLNHSAYAERTDLIDDLASLFRSGTRPPHVRHPAYHQLFNRDLGTYWRYLLRQA